MIHGDGRPVRPCGHKKPMEGTVSRLLRSMCLLALPWALLAVALPVLAQNEPAQPAEIEAPPPLPPKVQGEQLEPTVEIRTEDDKIIEEYSLDGRVYMVKVTPKVGPPYYYLDEDGTGELRLQPGDESLGGVQPVYWKVKEWK